ncbi:MAG: glycosyltransferase family 4 protein [Chloroflexi bacterium]|nr:glycosyltransferase family 4 protein [Chloroflexota bacterium]
MRIAMVANWWYRRGGLGGVMLDEAAWLTRRGHEILPFAAAHEANLETGTAHLFPRFVETSDLGQDLMPIDRLRAARAIIHNPEAAKRFGEFVRQARPDLVHVHGTLRQLSPSILGVARAAGLPIVMTIHDYGLVCPQGLLLKGGRAACISPNCVRGNPVFAIRYRCIKGSVAASALGAVEQLVHRSLGWYRDRVDLFIAPSRFLLNVVGGSGAIRREQLRHLPNGLAIGPTPSRVPDRGGHVLFVGRLVAEKGVNVLLEAARRLPAVPVVIAGDGPVREALTRAAPSNVTFTGHQDQMGLEDLRRRAVAVVSPSVWYENAPLSVLEAMHDGRPVVATDIGGQPELLEQGGGTLVPTGDAEGLAQAIADLWSDRTLAGRRGTDGHEAFMRRFTADRHVAGLEAIYGEALAARVLGRPPGGSPGPGAPRATA